VALRDKKRYWIKKKGAGRRAYSSGSLNIFSPLCLEPFYTYMIQKPEKKLVPSLDSGLTMNRLFTRQAQRALV
jgi:hypothetical protein